MKIRDDLSDLPPEMADTVRAFRRELIAEREEQERRLREALDHFKREMEIEIAVYRRLVEIFKGMWPSDDMAARRVATVTWRVRYTTRSRWTCDRSTAPNKATDRTGR